MPFGLFDEQNREYVIINPRTPVKWINDIGTLSFGGIVDHSSRVLIGRCVESVLVDDVFFQGNV